MDKPNKSKDEFKRRVESALEKHHEKDWVDIQKEQGMIKKQVHGKPEKAVEKACMDWMRERGWSVNVFEAKATWNGQAWVQKGMRAGTSDCLGSTNDGMSVAIEFKAPGKLSTFNSDKRYLQRKFIVDKINTYNFACVIDSVKRLEEIYLKWTEELKKSKHEAKQYLLSMLP